MGEVKPKCEKSLQCNPHISNNKIFHGLSYRMSKAYFILENCSLAQLSSSAVGGDIRTFEVIVQLC